MDIKEIRSLIDLMKKNGVAVFKMEKEGFKITLKTSGAPGSPQYISTQPLVQWSEPAAQPVAITDAAPASPAASGFGCAASIISMCLQETAWP